MKRIGFLNIIACKAALLFAAACVLIDPAPSSGLCVLQGDSLLVFMVGDAAATYQQSSWYKGSQNGFMRAVLSHEIDTNWVATVGVRGYNALPVPFLETGALTWKDRALEISGGYLTSRYGQSRYYKTWSTYNPLFEKPIIFDDYGFGGAASLHSGILTVQGGAVMNSRENGAAHGYMGIETPAFRAGVLCGFQTYSLEDQDNDLTLGFESSAESDAVKLHTAMRFMHGFGYALNAQSSVLPGDRFDGFLEARLLPFRTVTVDILGIYRTTRHYYSNSEVFTGLDCRWLLGRIWGVGGSGEYTDDDGIVSWSPEVRLYLAPAADPTQLSIGVKRTWTGDSSPLYQATGNVCIAW